MALIKDYEIQGTGVTVPNAYHVITDLKVHKRMADHALPVDNSTPTGLTNNGVRAAEDLPVYWQAGYIGRIWVTIWATAQARIDNMTPIGVAGINATEVDAEISIGTKGLDARCEFMLNMADDAPTDLVQAYTHLKSLDFYAGCTED
ncbi:MAG: hypothetical protein ACKVJK_05605 [Methylophagaceae bacterium]|jgi:hypothetical protein|tara:strand:+ start:164 stop:604 length:441 start_codon:yes stop_codon:yes gene_type:complete